MIGLKRGTVELLPHDPEWDVVAEQTVTLFKQILGAVAIDVRHVGSTSIASIKAKPIIDIAVAVKELSDIEPMIPTMEQHGFYLKNLGDPDQVFFSAGDFQQDIRTHHIHVVRYNSMEWLNYLNFTAYLNSHPSVARRYEQVKESLLNRFSNDRNAYTEGKAVFIQHTLRKAMVWSYLGKNVEIGIDRPIGYAHKKDIVYPINYGYIPGVLGGDQEELDVYLLGVDEPVTSYRARIIAIVHRENDVEDKLVALPEHMALTQAEITEAVHFQEKYYDSHIEALYGHYTVKEYREYREDEILSLYHAVGWSRYTDEPETLRQSFDHSLCTLAAYENDLLIGLIRTVGDGFSSVLIQDLLVHPSYQRQGIGTTLLQEIRTRYRSVYQMQLLIDRDTKMLEFYRKRGFDLAQNEKIVAMTACKNPKVTPMPVIRPITDSDIEDCVELIRRSFMTVANEFGLTMQNAPRFTAFATDTSRLKTQHGEGRPMFVFEDDKGTPIGYYSLCHKDTDTVELNQLCIDPAHRHRKLGEKMLLHAIREGMVRGYRHMTIGIVEENQRLRTWYEKYGFVHTGTQKFDFFPFTCGYMNKKLYGEDG